MMHGREKSDDASVPRPPRVQIAHGRRGRVAARGARAAASDAGDRARQLTGAQRHSATPRRTGESPLSTMIGADSFTVLRDSNLSGRSKSHDPSGTMFPVLISNRQVVGPSPAPA